MTAKRNCPNCPSDEPGWLAREIKAAEREVKRWPKWIRDLHLFEERTDADQPGEKG